MTKDKIEIAEKYQKDAEYKKALDIYIDILKNDADNLKVLVSVGNCYDAIGDKGKAIEFYELAHKKNKKSIFPIVNLSIIFYELGESKQSEKYAKEALKIDDRNISALVILGNIYYKNRDFDDALEYYLKAFYFNKNHLSSCVNVANTYIELKQYNMAVIYAKKAIEISPDNCVGYSILGNAYKELEQYDEALKNLELAVKYNDKDAWTYNYLSQIYQKNGDVVKALDGAYRSVQLSGGDNNHHINLGYMLYEMSILNYDACVDVAMKWNDEFGDNNIVKHMANSVINKEKLSRANDEYLKSIFDIFAPDFEYVLTSLEYKVPELIGQYLHDFYGNGILKKLKILDAGCGTGLCAKYLKKYAKVFGLHGVDISEQMVKVAEKKHLYNKLFVSELVSFLSSKKEEYDLIVAADVLTYFGELKDVFTYAKTSLKKNGRIMFSISENTINDDDIFLHLSGRFLHTRKYIENILKNNDFELEKIIHERIRNEGEKKVMGFIISAKKMTV